jgi:hypothetical protein
LSLLSTDDHGRLGGAASGVGVEPLVDLGPALPEARSAVELNDRFANRDLWTHPAAIRPQRFTDPVWCRGDGVGPGRGGYGRHLSDQEVDAMAADRGPQATDDPAHQRPPATDDAVVAAVGKVSEALEWIERVRGRLYDFHQMMGRADFLFGDAADALADAGCHEEAEVLRREVVGRNVLDGRWTFQMVEEFEDCYYEPVRSAERDIRESLMAEPRASPATRVGQICEPPRPPCGRRRSQIWSRFCKVATGSCLLRA